MVQIFTKQFSHTYFVVQAKKVSLLLGILCLGLSAYCQDISLSDIFRVANSGKKFDQVIRRYGFRSVGLSYQKDTTFYVYNFLKVPKPLEVDSLGNVDSTKLEERIFRQVLRSTINNDELFTFRTSLAREDSNIKDELKKNGYSICGNEKFMLCQKGNIVVKCCLEKVDTEFVYSYRFYFRQLPKAKDILFAEDLFQINSHEYLTAVFGRENVKKDLFYLQGNKTTPCSVIFPNTKYEAVFVWAAPEEYRGILALRIGGDPKTKSSLQFQRSIEQNIWQSREGVYVGMSMQELKKASERNIVATNSFKKNASDDNYSGKMGLLLGCMNCGDAHYLQADYSNLTESIDESQKVYISTMILAGKQSKK